MDSLKSVKGVWIKNQVGPRVGRSEACRGRIEEYVAEDTSDERAQQAKERLEQLLAQKIGEGDEKGERDDPQNHEPNIEKQEAPKIAIDAPMKTEHLQIRSPVRLGQDVPED